MCQTVVYCQVCVVKIVCKYRIREETPRVAIGLCCIIVSLIHSLSSLLPQAHAPTESLVLSGSNHDTIALVLVPRNAVTPVNASSSMSDAATLAVAAAARALVVVVFFLVVVVFFLVVLILTHFDPDFLYSVLHFQLHFLLTHVCWACAGSEAWQLLALEHVAARLTSPGAASGKGREFSFLGPLQSVIYNFKNLPETSRGAAKALGASSSASATADERRESILASGGNWRGAGGGWVS